MHSIHKAPFRVLRDALRMMGDKDKVSTGVSNARWDFWLICVICVLNNLFAPERAHTGRWNRPTRER